MWLIDNLLIVYLKLSADVFLQKANAILTLIAFLR